MPGQEGNSDNLVICFLDFLRNNCMLSVLIRCGDSNEYTPHTIP